jgi:hypothetical protein
MSEKDARDAAANAERDAVLKSVRIQLTEMQKAPNAPQDQLGSVLAGLDQFKQIGERWDSLRGTDAKNQPPWWVKEVKESINLVGDQIGKGLEGMGALEAGKRGLPPPGKTPQGPPGSSAVYQPEYIDEDTAPPQPPTGTRDPYPELANHEASPGDPSSWPDIPYSARDEATGGVMRLTKEQFVARFGSRIYNERRAAGVLPSQRPPSPPAPAPAPPAAAPESEKPSAPAAARPSVFSRVSGRSGLAPTPRAGTKKEEAPPARAPPPEPVPTPPAEAPPPETPPEEPPAEAPPEEAPPPEAPPAAPPPAQEIPPDATIDKEGNVTEGGSGEVRPA